MFCSQSTKVNEIRTLFGAVGKNITILHGSMLYDVLVGHYISHYCTVDSQSRIGIV